MPDLLEDLPGISALPDLPSADTLPDAPAADPVATARAYALSLPPGHPDRAGLQQWVQLAEQGNPEARQFLASTKLPEIKPQSAPSGATSQPGASPGLANRLPQMASDLFNAPRIGAERAAFGLGGQIAKTGEVMGITQPGSTAALQREADASAANEPDLSATPGATGLAKAGEIAGGVAPWFVPGANLAMPGLTAGARAHDLNAQGADPYTAVGAGAGEGLGQALLAGLAGKAVAPIGNAIGAAASPLGKTAAGALSAAPAGALVGAGFPAISAATSAATGDQERAAQEAQQILPGALLGGGIGMAAGGLAGAMAPRAPMPIDPNAVTQMGLDPVRVLDSRGNEPLDPVRGDARLIEARIAANGGSPGAQLGAMSAADVAPRAWPVPEVVDPNETQFAPVRPGDSFDVGATTGKGVSIPDPADVAIRRGLGARLAGGSPAELGSAGVTAIGGKDITPEFQTGASQGLGAMLKQPGQPDLPLETPTGYHPDQIPGQPWPQMGRDADGLPSRPMPDELVDNGLPAGAPRIPSRRAPALPQDPTQVPSTPWPALKDPTQVPSTPWPALKDPTQVPSTPWPRMAADEHGLPPLPHPDALPEAPARPKAEAPVRAPSEVSPTASAPKPNITPELRGDTSVDVPIVKPEESPGQETSRGQGTPLSPKAEGLVASLSPEERTALEPSITHLKANPDPAGDFGNLKMLLDMNRAKAQKIQAGGFATKAQVAERKAAPAVDRSAETRVMEPVKDTSNAQPPAPRKDVSSPRQSAPTERSLRPVEPETPRNRDGASDGSTPGERPAPEAPREEDVSSAGPAGGQPGPGAPRVPETAAAPNRAHSPGDRVTFDTPSLKGVRGKVVADTGKPNVRVESDLGETMSVPRKNVRAAEGEEAFRKRYLGGNNARSGQAINPIEGAAELVERAAKTLGSMVKARPEQAARDQALDVLKKTDRARQAESFNALQKAKEWKKELTGPELEDVTRAIEKTLPKGKTLTDAQIRVKNQVSAAYEAMRKTINDFVLKGTGEGAYLRQLENYVAHFYKNGDTAGVRGQVANWVKNSPSAKKRLLPTFEEAKKIGLEPLTENSADLFAKYAEVNWKSAANRVFIDQIKKIDLANGLKAAMPAADAPSDWPRLPMPAGDNYAFHPDIFPAVRNMMDNAFGGNFVKGVENLLAMTKSLALEGSLFHHLTLTQGGVAAGYTLRNPLRGLGLVGENGKAFQFSAGRGQELLKDPEFVRDAVGHGLSLKAPIDVGGEQNVKVMARWADKAPDLVKRFAKGAADRYAQWHDMLWSLRDGLKAHSYEAMVGRALEHAPEDITPEAIDHLKEKMADAANNFFGGQQWKEKLWLSPKMRQMANWFMLAPDWTLSSAKLATEPLTAAAKGDKANLAIYGRYLFGMGMVLTASTVALHGAIYGAFGDPEKGDHPYPWQNESGQGTQVDVTPLYRAVDHLLGKPETQQRHYASFGKQERELVRWVEDPQHELINKMSPLARAGMEQVFNASGDPDFPVPWKGEGFWDSIPARAKEAAKVFLPYGVQGNSFALTLPERKGMTPYKAREATAAALTVYATGTGEEGDLHDLVADVLSATEQNGHDPEKAFHDGLAKARSPFYGAYLAAMQIEDEKGMEKAAAALERLESSVQQVKASAKTRGIELTDMSALDDAGVRLKPPARHHARK